MTDRDRKPSEIIDENRAAWKEVSLEPFLAHFRSALGSKMQLNHREGEVVLYPKDRNVGRVIKPNRPSDYYQTFERVARDVYLNSNPLDGLLRDNETGQLRVDRHKLLSDGLQSTKVDELFRGSFTEDVGFSERAQTEITSIFQETFVAALEAVATSGKEAWTSETIRNAVSMARRSAPTFGTDRGLVNYKEAPARNSDFRERKRVARRRSKELNDLCQLRSNEQPQLLALCTRYSTALRALTTEKGSYSLHLAGLAIQSHIEIAAKLPQDAARNPALDADLLSAAHQLIVAHAGLISLFPDIAGLDRELDGYLQNSRAIDALKNRVLEPVLDGLVASSRLLETRTKRITAEIKDLETEQRETSQGSTAAKHSWLRGLLATLGNYVLDQVKAVAKVARDATVKAIVSDAFKRSGLFASALSFLFESRSVLLRIAQELENSFGWLRHLLRYLGFAE